MALPRTPVRPVRTSLVRRLAPLALAAVALACSSSDDDAAATGTQGTGGAAGAGGSGVGGSTDCAEAKTILDLSAAPGAGASYPKPTLTAACKDGKLVVEGNGIPPYTFVQTTPNPLKAVQHHWEIPLDPQPAAQTTEIPLLGTVGFAVNGLPFFGPNEGAQPAESAYGDPVFNGLMDPCLGHTADEYHYHSFLEKCLTQASLVEKPWTSADPDATKASPILGWALDGFPIYGSRECVDAGCSQTRTVKSGYEKTGDPTKNAWQAYTWKEHPGDDAYLDACNGKVGADGKYRYHATETFPYILGCFRGTANGAGMQGQGGMGGMTTGPKTCAQPSDCAGACPPDAKGCTCATTPMGMQCVPTCTTATDCPKTPNGMTLQCKSGACVP